MGLAFDATRGLYERMRPIMGVVNLLSGVLLIIVGILIFTERLIDLNQFFQVDFLNFSGNK
jgi:threonine/homoserine/homoserine lactone efflux protein